MKQSGAEVIVRDGSTVNYFPVSEISSSGGVSGDYWESGGDLSTCYGESIGNSSKAKVVDLDSRQLEGTWTTHGNHSVTSNLSVGNNAVIENRLIIGHVQIYETVV